VRIDRLGRDPVEKGLASEQRPTAYLQER